ncbi:hypothetical protein BJY01DRAFT_215101 [Aspergillus pseudoustus]|uniref:Uncharacterized protein n=1 Tax=Aspergillus pseudoustus TaxID=1810923 RepID=A0ABR4JW78_9EURO
MASVSQNESRYSSDFITIHMEGSYDSQSISSAGTEEEQPELSDLSGEEQFNTSPSPKHPIPELQGPFEESIFESLPGANKDWVVDLDAQSRRRDLLEGPRYERLCGRKWRQRSGERYHPFWKLSAQMSFGIHLLVKGTAKSNAAVLNILQAHVDEMDGFVSRTSEDFLIIQVDLRTRIQYLSLPLENLDLFDEMLLDRNFRLAMIDYNDKIELAIERFTLAINDSLKDIQKGKEAISGLWQYLSRPAKNDTPLSGNLAAIHESMLANTEGWNLAFSKLRKKGTALLYAITQLGRAIVEMQRRVGVASRRDVVSFVPPLPTPQAKSIRGFFDRGMSVYMPNPSPPTDKPLPQDPALASILESRHRPTFSSSGRLAHQKSVPNLGASRDDYATKDTFERAKSTNGARALSRGSDTGSILPRLQKTISRRLSRANLAKVTVGQVPEETITRPSTSASQTLKSFRKSRYTEQPALPQQQQQPQIQENSSLKSRPSIRSRRPGTSHTSAKGETMKNQLRQYFMSDRVLDAWESVREKERKPGQSESKTDGLWSLFQAKPGTRFGILPEVPYQNDVQTQMAWLEEETKNLNTYSLKPKQGTGPRVHTITDDTGVRQGLDVEESNNYGGFNYLKALEADDTIVTALPAFPLPPIGHMPASNRGPC